MMDTKLLHNIKRNCKMNRHHKEEPTQEAYTKGDQRVSSYSRRELFNKDSWSKTPPRFSMSPRELHNQTSLNKSLQWSGYRFSRHKRLVQQSAQMSFRIHGQSGHDADYESSECDPCPKYQAKANISSGGSSSTSDTEEIQLRRKMGPDPYKDMEVDCDKFFRSKNQDYTPTPNLLKSEESVAIICGKVNGKQTTMLLDTGSSISAITESFAQQLHLETWYTDDVLVVTLANTHVDRYPERMCIVTLEIGDLQISEELNILPGQIYNITLGKNWLKAHMAICDHGLDILRLPGSRPIRMGLSAPPHSLKSALKKKKVCKPKRQSVHTTDGHPYYPSLRTLLFLGGWLPPCLRTDANP